MSPAAPIMKMSEHEIPLHIQEEILKRLPVKSLVQFRSVSKAWKCLIDSSEFIAAHGLRCQTQSHHLLVSYESWIDDRVNHVCYVDDDTFPQQRSVPTLPLSVKELESPEVVDSSHGLLCLFGYDPEMFVLWNPTIRKSLVVVAAACNLSVAGFGVCHVTSDPKIVSVTHNWDNQYNECHPIKAMVYTLSSGKWRSLSTNLTIERLQYWCSQVVVTDRFIYWCARTQTNNMIMSFDVTSESFQMIDLPDTLARHDLEDMNICKLKESLSILHSERKTCTIWVMEDGVQRLFTKLFTIKTPCGFIAGFRKNGIPIMHVRDGNRDYDDADKPRKLVYEPYSEHDDVIETCPSLDVIDVNSYVETLLLLGRSDCDSY